MKLTVGKQLNRPVLDVSRYLILGAMMLLVGSCAVPPVPDQSQFVPLDALADSGTAVVRVYAAPIRGIETIAVHSWFVVKRADATEFDRWEVWQAAGGPYGHVRNNLQSPTDDVGAGGTFVLAELVGAEAEPVVEFIESESPDYLCKDRYVYFPGPNSNTYTQWVLDSTGWNVALPRTAIGKAVQPACP